MAVNPTSTPSVVTPGVSPVRGWATSTVWAGALWIVCAVLPIPGTTLLGLPLSLYAIVGGFITAWLGGNDGDRAAMRRGRWGLGLGCAGYVYLIAFFTLAGGLLLAGVIAAWRAAGNQTP